MSETIEITANVSPVNPNEMKQRIHKGIYGLEPFKVVVTASEDNVVKILDKQIITIDFSGLTPEEDDE